MKILLKTLLPVVMMLLAVSNIALAQDASSSGGIVAVLDVAKVFKEHSSFNVRMEQLKKEVEAFDALMKQKSDELRQEMEGLKDNFQTTSEEFKTGQAELARKDADLKIQANQKRQEILDKEAQLYLTTYEEIQEIVQQLATKYGITLVLRYDSADIDQNDRASVIKGVNRPIIFQRNLDLTNHVLPIVKTAAVQGNNTKK